jgi:hypothetical protein
MAADHQCRIKLITDLLITFITALDAMSAGNGTAFALHATLVS